MKAISKMESVTAKENVSMPMVVFTQVNTKKTNLQAMASTNGKKVKIMTDIGRMDFSMAKESKT